MPWTQFESRSATSGGPSSAETSTIPQHCRRLSQTSATVRRGEETEVKRGFIADETKDESGR